MRPRRRVVTAAVILAAGASTRLGTPKQLILLENETLLDRAVRIAHEAGCSPLIVVLGANAREIERACTLPNSTIIFNDQWNEGMGSSVRHGIAAVNNSEGAIVMTCDMPAVMPQHLRALMASGVVTASRYAERNGVPAYFPGTSFAALMTASGDTGARILLRSAPSIDLPQGDLDIDTPQDVIRLKEQFA